MKLALQSCLFPHWMNRSWILLVACFVITPVFGQKAASSNDAISRVANAAIGENESRGSSIPTAFEQMESDAITFVKEHHPELVSLLQLLKAMREKEYETAIRDIDRVRKRLETLVKREPETYQIELDGWKIQSKIDLLLAKGLAKDKAFNAKNLRGLLKDQVEIQKKRLKNEQANIAKRQEQLADQLQKLEGRESERVEQQFVLLMKRVDAKVDKPDKPKPETKPAKETKVKS